MKGLAKSFWEKIPAPFSLGRIPAARMEWVATSDAPQALCGSTQSSMFFYGGDKVGAAGRLKPAPWAQPGAHPELVAPGQKNQYPARRSDADLPQVPDHGIYPR